MVRKPHIATQSLRYEIICVSEFWSLKYSSQVQVLYQGIDILAKNCIAVFEPSVGDDQSIAGYGMRGPEYLKGRSSMIGGLALEEDIEMQSNNRFQVVYEDPEAIR